MLTSMSENRAPVNKVIGRNFRRIREAAGLTQDQAAQYVRGVGPLWTSTRVSDFERGRNDVTAGLLAAVSIAMTSALRDAERRGIKIGITAQPADFMQHEGQVSLTSMGPDPLGSALSKAFAGTPWPEDDLSLLGANGAATKDIHENVSRSLSGFTTEELAEVEAEHQVEDIKRKAGLAEHRVAQRLGIKPDRLAELSWDVLGQTFTEARNELAGDDASPQKRGRIARDLEARLRMELGRGDDK